MLRLKSIMKSYTTADFTQNALDGVSVAFRDNEFAAVLGPSGSGKTTMLNIIGGLDRYDSGDLEIDNISTKNYKASDWDTYRNNRIGFVFQSYNLIPHQSVLANVELALTLSGVSMGERRKRAKQALTEVGLGEHIRKKPGQLSGGQMQRVAIARALINDPEILLADEPTGALDTETSKQVMELLTKIAEDRLVIMVTHNNELAKQYANRLIHLTDGKVTSDTRPYDPTQEEQREGREPRKSSMSFWTAIMLSFSNLMTKKGRTITTAFAGSIGIIGIGTILAFSNGINAYIRTIEEETLSIYPLVIQVQGFDLSRFFGGDDESGDGQGHGQGERRPERPPDTVREMRIMETVFSTQHTNDLASLKMYFEENEHILEMYASTIHYMYDITPQIFLSDTSNGVDQINPDSIFSNMMGPDTMNTPGANFMPGMNVFSEMPNDPELYESQYDILAGHWPENYDEAVLVLGFGRRITDFALFSMGIRDRSEMREMLEIVMNRGDSEFEFSESEGDFSYETFLDLTFKVIPPAKLFQYDETFSVWVDKSGDNEFMETLVSNSTPLRIVGIVQPSQDAQATVLSTGVNYTPGLIIHLMEQAAQARIVRSQLDNPEINVLTGNSFDDERDNPEPRFDFARIISVDEDVFRDAMDLDNAFSAFDFSEMDLGLSDIDLSSLDLSGMDFSNLDFGSFDFGNLNFDISALPPPDLDIGDLIATIAAATGLTTNDLMAVINAIFTDFTDTLSPLDFIDPDFPNNLLPLFEEYINSQRGQAILAQQLALLQIDPTQLTQQITAAVQGFLMEAMTGYMEQMVGMIQLQIQRAMQGATAQISQTMQSTMRQVSRQMQRAMRDVTQEIEESIMTAFEEMSEELQSSMDGVDGESLAEAFQIEMGEEEVLDLMMAIMNPIENTFAQNLAMLGFADPSEPTQIMIYPRSFEAKQAILDILDDYNNMVEAMGMSERVIYFIDIVGMMMSSITEIIDIVSYALIAFVSVALVVSSIMIGVITFISVLERKKEIGILRAVGASKGNIRLVFNAETLIIGFVAGVLGVLATFGISVVANIILYNLVDIEQLVIIPYSVPIALVIISMFLTYIAGLLPASAAASKPPVDALRSE